MKLKPQPPVRRRASRASRPRRSGLSILGRGRQARRPGVPLRSRLARRLPSIRRLIAGVAAVAIAAVLVALVAGPWLRVREVVWAGERYTDGAAIGDALAAERGRSLLAVDTDAARERIERLPTVASASVTVSLTGRIEAAITERQAAFLWETGAATFIGSADGTIIAGGRDASLAADLATLPRISDERFRARLVSVGDIIDAPLLRVAMRLAAIDPATFGSVASAVAIHVDDTYGFRLVSSDPAWEVALGVYGLDPEETAAEADARLDRQVTAIRTLFAAHPETGLGWVDVRNPGKVYFRAKG